MEVCVAEEIDLIKADQNKVAQGPFSLTFSSDVSEHIA
jgi:hypothetical protein